MGKSVSSAPVAIPKTSPAATTHANSDDGDLASDPLTEDATIPAAAAGTEATNPEQENAELASLLQTAVKAEAHPADYEATIAALQAEISRLQKLSSASPSGASRDVPAAASKNAPAKDDDKNSDNAAAADEAADELAQAQAMADAALAAQPLTAAAQTYSTDEAATQAATRGGRHHGLDNFTHSNLGPDANDPKHHTMSSLF